MNNTLKKFFVLGLVLAFAALCYCSMRSDWSEKYGAKFQGVPICGTKTEMLQKLNKAGFEYSSDSTYMTGLVDGRQSNIMVVTDKVTKKVWRVAVSWEHPTTADSIKGIYNALVMRYLSDNTNYFPITPYSETYLIPDNEDISYEIIVNGVEYCATFYQITDTPVDITAACKWMRNTHIPEYYAPMSREDIMFEYMSKIVSQKVVKFIIRREGENQYTIAYYFDNENNLSDGY